MQAGLRAAAVVTTAAILAFIAVYELSQVVDAGSGAAIMSATLALSLARRPAVHRLRAVLFELLMLPLVGLAAAAVGWTLHALPIVGAIGFVAGMFFSVWSRQFGPIVRRVGSLVAMPLVAMLVVPAGPHAPGGPIVDALLVLLAGIVALGSVLLVQAVAQRIGAPPAIVVDVPVRRRPMASGGNLSGTTRMAIQLAVALSVAFAVGGIWFAQHAMWVVFTAYIVCASSRGRGDVLYTSLLRFFGAAAGTIAAALLAHVSLPTGAREATLIFAAIFAGTWLRGTSYAYWAACVTLVVALLQNGESGASIALLELRLLEILVGGACGVAAAWFVLPVRTQAVVLRYVADALAAFAEVPRAPDDQREERLRALDAAVRRLDAIPAARLHRDAAPWIRNARRYGTAARAYVGDSAVLLRAIGNARKALAHRARPERFADEPVDDLAIALDKLDALLRDHEAAST